jgi:hypothetical protein
VLSRGAGVAIVGVATLRIVQVFFKVAPLLWKSAKQWAEKLRETDRRKHTDPNKVLTPEEKQERSHANVRLITRVSLRTIMPDARSVFANLFKTLEVVEPTYKDIILLYRCAPSPFGPVMLCMKQIHTQSNTDSCIR